MSLKHPLRKLASLIACAALVVAFNPSPDGPGEQTFSATAVPDFAPTLVPTTMVDPPTTTSAPPAPTTTERQNVRAAAETEPVVAEAEPAVEEAVEPSGDVWEQLAYCESGMTNDTGDPYWGYFQFSIPTWHGIGESGYPSDYGYEHQKAAAQRLQARSGWGQWPGCSRQLGLR